MKPEPTFDALTGLPGWQALLEALDQERHVSPGVGRPFAVLYAGFDQIIITNSSLGSHPVNERNLRTLASRLREGLTPGEAVFRPGGDDFIFLLPNADLDHAVARAHAIREGVTGLWPERKAYPPQMPPELSIGVVACPVSDVIDRSLLLRQAEDLMYEAKAPGNAKAVRSAWYSGSGGTSANI